MAMVAIGCGSESPRPVEAPNDDAAVVDEDRNIDERIPTLTGDASGAAGMAGDGDGDGDASADDAAVDESDVDASIPQDGGEDSSVVAPTDSDNDGTADDIDRCVGHDDRVDADGDSTPDGCDDCPKGAPAACDVVLWRLVRASSKVRNQSAVGITTTLGIGDSNSTIGVTLALPSSSASQDASSADVAEVAGIVAGAGAGLVGVVQYALGVDFEIPPGTEVACPFDPARATIRRVSMVGFANESGFAAATWEIRGYLD